MNAGDRCRDNSNGDGNGDGEGEEKVNKKEREMDVEKYNQVLIQSLQKISRMFTQNWENKEIVE